MPADKDKEESNISGANIDDEYIGTAWLEDDGTICLRLTARAGDGTVGQGLLHYAIGDEHYQAVLDHLGHFAPGEIKPVRPFPD